MTHRLGTLALAVALVATTRTAHAQSAEAEALFNDGDRLMAAGKLAEACEAFEASNRSEPRAGTLIRLGECREKNQQLASAWSAYKDALTRVKDPKKKDIATAAVASLEPRLSYLTVSVPDDSRVAGLVVTRNGKEMDPALWNRAIPVDGGAYTIGARAPGREDWSKTIDVPVESGKVAVDVEALVEIEQPTGPGVAGPAGPAGGGGRRDDGDVTFTGKRKLAVGVGAAGVIVLGVGAVMGVSAKGARDDAYALCPDPAMPCGRAAEANALIAKGQSRATFANLSYGVGAAALVGAAVLWFTGAPDESSRRVSVAPRLGATNGLDLVVRF